MMNDGNGNKRIEYLEETEKESDGKRQYWKQKQQKELRKESRPGKTEGTLKGKGGPTRTKEQLGRTRNTRNGKTERGEN